MKQLLLSDHLSQEAVPSPMKFDRFVISKKRFSKASAKNPISLKQGRSPHVKGLGQVLI